MRLTNPLTLSAMRLAHAPLKSVARNIAAESPLPLPNGERRWDSRRRHSEPPLPTGERVAWTFRSKPGEGALNCVQEKRSPKVKGTQPAGRGC